MFDPLDPTFVSNYCGGRRQEIQAIIDSFNETHCDKSIGERFYIAEKAYDTDGNKVPHLLAVHSSHAAIALQSMFQTKLK
jgi:hypothetical protein